MFHGKNRGKEKKAFMTIAFAVACLAISSVLIVASACSFDNGSKVVAKAGDIAVMADEVDSRITSMKDSLGMSSNNDAWKSWLADNGLDEYGLECKVIEQTAKEKLVDEFLTSHGVTSEDIDVSDKIASEKAGLSDREWASKLASAGYDIKTYDADVARMIAASKLVNNGEISDNDIISESNKLKNILDGSKYIQIIPLSSDVSQAASEISSLPSDAEGFSKEKKSRDAAHKFDGWTFDTEPYDKFLKALEGTDYGKIGNPISCDDENVCVFVSKTIHVPKGGWKTKDEIDDAIVEKIEDMLGNGSDKESYAELSNRLLNEAGGLSFMAKR